MLPIRFYWMMLLRRMPLMIAVVTVVTGLAIYFALNMAPVYTSFARLQVEAPQIPDEMVASIVETEANEQLQLIEERLLTRANLLEIARKHQVYEIIDEMSPDEIVNAMLNSTTIERRSGRNEATRMRIAFTARTGEIAADVVNDFTTLVLEDNASSRRERAENTLSFFEQETERLAADIEAQSNRIIEFKRENIDALPEDLNYRQQRQGILQERLSRLEQERVSVANQRNEMVTLFETTGRLDSEVRLTPEQERLQELQQQLNEARAIYSETNPRVVILRNQVAQLEQAMAGPAGAATEEEAASPRSSMIDITLAEMDHRLDEIDREVVLVNEELEDLAGVISTTTTNAITLERLERDLESIRDRYNDTLDNLNQARMAERVEVNAQGQRILLIEGAVVPEQPSSTSRTKVAVAGMGLGMMLAGGLFVLLEFLNQKLRHPAEIKSRFNIVPIGVIPYMETRMERVRRRWQLLGGAVASAAVLSLALYYMHTQLMPLEILADRILGRLGLV
jgi:uncharacterized protein involved in exopolysaccharide biosynthesis